MKNHLTIEDIRHFPMGIVDGLKFDFHGDTWTIVNVATFPEPHVVALYQGDVKSKRGFGLPTIKPYLRSLDQIDKPITLGGETVNLWKEIVKEAVLSYDWVVRFTLEENCLEIFDRDGVYTWAFYEVRTWPHWIVEMLYEHSFNVDNLDPSLFIEITQ